MNSASGLRDAAAIFSGLACACVSISAKATIDDGHFLKSNVAYSCIAPDNVMLATRIFLDDGRYGEQWTSERGTRHVSHIVTGRWKTESEPRKTQLLIFSENVKEDAGTNQQRPGQRPPEQLNPSKSNPARLYFYDAKTAEQLLTCDEATAETTTAMRELTNNLWDSTKVKRAEVRAYETRVSSCAETIDAAKAERDAMVARGRALALITAAQRKGGSCGNVAPGQAQNITQTDADLNKVKRMYGQGGAKLDARMWRSYCTHYAGISEFLENSCR